MLVWVDYKGSFFKNSKDIGKRINTNTITKRSVYKCKLIFDRLDRNSDGVLDLH